jgi:hypothetical protein
MRKAPVLNSRAGDEASPVARAFLAERCHERRQDHSARSELRPAAMSLGEQDQSED